MEEQIKSVERRVGILEKNVAVLDDKQIRMYEDMGKLTQALEGATRELNRVNNFIANKKGFFGGVITTISILSAVFGATLALVWDRIAP